MQPSQAATHAAAMPASEKPAETEAAPIAAAVEKLIVWIGSITSLVLHTLAFAAFFSVAALHWVGWDTMFLVLTTVVSLEAIYLSIFIQFSVNRQAASLKEVEENVEELGESVEDIQVDVEELGEHVESIKEEIEEISEDESEEAAEDARKQKQAETLEALTRDVQVLLRHLEQLKAR